MKKIIFTALVTFCFSIIIKAQQREQFTQYMVNPYILNPAVGGSEKYVDVKAGMRQQWVGFNGAPETYYFSAHSEIGRDLSHYHGHYKYEHKGWHGIGTYIANDVTGPTSFTTFNFSYAYHQPIIKGVYASLGASFGTMQYRLDGSKLDFGVIQGNAPAAPIETRIQATPDVTIGGYIYSDNFFLGASIFGIANNKLYIQNLSQGKGGQLANHYYLMGGIYIPLDSYDEWKAVPSFMVKVNHPAPPSVDLNLRLMYKTMAWVGANVRAGESFGALAGITVANVLDVGYSYDYNTNKLSSFNGGSHEVLVGYRINIKDRIKCPGTK